MAGEDRPYFWCIDVSFNVNFNFMYFVNLDKT